MKGILITFLALGLAVPAAAEESVVKLFAGLNGIWYQGPGGVPSDVEAGGTARASLSPHLSLVGGAFWGFQNSYVRGSAGVRLTATDVQNPNFSVGLGLEYQASSEPALRPQEWAGTVTVGWRPLPEKLPRVVLGVQGITGLDSRQIALVAAIRYQLPLYGGKEGTGE